MHAHAAALRIIPAAPPARTARREPQPPAWDPSLLPPGLRFPDPASFREHVRQADFIGRGTLTSWDQGGGSVAIEEVYLGRADRKEVPLIYDGGFIRTTPGDKVVVLLRTRDGKRVLHSFCPRSGLYACSDYLAAQIRAAVKAHATEG